VICNALFVQRGAPDALRGRAFTLLMSSNYVVLGLGMIAAGPLTKEIGPRGVWALAGALSAVAAVVGLILARGVDTRSHTVTEPGLQTEPVETARI
jgi:hypothetical protein